MSRFFLGIAAMLGMLAFPGSELLAQDDVPDEEAPEIRLDTPTGGSLVSKRFTIVGTVTDNVGVTEVRYRIEGEKRWRTAILVQAGAVSTTFTFRAKLRSGRGKSRVYVRAWDAVRNESDIVSRKFRRG